MHSGKLKLNLTVVPRPCSFRPGKFKDYIKFGHYGLLVHNFQIIFPCRLDIQSCIVGAAKRTAI